MTTSLQKAFQLGVEEFNKGGTIVPAQCKELLGLMKDLKVGEGSIELMKAFQRGFIAA